MHLQDYRSQKNLKLQRSDILAERERLEKELLQLAIVQKIYPSSANFLLVEVDDANNLYNSLVMKNVIVRNRNSVIKNCIRITVGSKQENDILLTELKEISQ